MASAPEDFLDPQTQAFYRRMLVALDEARVPFLIGGAYGLAHYTGIERHTKDLDVFIHRRDYERATQTLASVGCKTELTFPHWLGKARCGEDFIDVIFSSGNGIAGVDDEWFEHARDGSALGKLVRVVPPEEMIWSKAFIMERERFDGADINHLLRACSGEIDWERLLRRFGPHWRVLLSHLLLFGFVCRGTLLSRAQYLVDLERWGYEDPRLMPTGSMSWREVARWTAAIGQER
jgi:hypothetical protein